MSIKKNVIHVPVSSNKKILSYFIKDEGINWQENVKQWFLANGKAKYDVVIITGGPFMHMRLSKFFNRNGIKNVILDFRDPFYGNPRFSSSKIKNLIKLYFQNKFIKYANHIISVNDYCANLLSTDKVKLIDNGYDDSFVVKEQENDVNENKIISIGRVYEDFNLDSFNKVLKSTQYQFYYYGVNFSSFVNNTNVFTSKAIDYQLVLDEINSSSLCVLFTGGKAFESTTKIFDFLRFNKKTLIITEGEVKTGALFDITKNNPNVYWSINSEKEIKSKIHFIMNTNRMNFDTKVYSRENSYFKLVELL